MFQASCALPCKQVWPEFRIATNRSNRQVLSPLSWIDIILIAALTGVSEELLFRGAIIPASFPDWRGALLAGSWGFFDFPMMDTARDSMIVSAIILGLLIHAFMYAGQPAIMAEMFPTRMRYSGVSLGYQVTSIVAGSRRAAHR